MGFPAETCIFLQEMRFPAEACAFQLKTACSCRKMHFPAEKNAAFWGAWQETEKIAGGVSGLKNQERWPSFTRKVSAPTQVLRNDDTKLRPVPNLPQDPAVLKTLWDSELLHRSVFTTPPYSLRCEPFFERRAACKTQGK